MSTRKTFVAVAASIKRTREETLTNAMLYDASGAAQVAQDAIMYKMAHSLANTFALLNPNFDYGKFMRACGYDN